MEFDISDDRKKKRELVLKINEKLKTLHETAPKLKLEREISEWEFKVSKQADIKDNFSLTDAEIKSLQYETQEWENYYLAIDGLCKMQIPFNDGTSASSTSVMVRVTNCIEDPNARSILIKDIDYIYRLHGRPEELRNLYIKLFGNATIKNFDDAWKGYEKYSVNQQDKRGVASTIRELIYDSNDRVNNYFQQRLKSQHGWEKTQNHLISNYSNSHHILKINQFYQMHHNSNKTPQSFTIYNLSEFIHRGPDIDINLFWVDLINIDFAFFSFIEQNEY